MGSDDDETNQSRLEYMSDGLLVSKRKSAFDLHPDEASPSRRCPRKVFLLDDWSVHDFLVGMIKDMFSRLRPRFHILNDMPIRKGHKGEKCYTEGLLDVGFYVVAFIAGLCLPLTSLHHGGHWFFRLGVSICQIALNAWRTFIGVEVLLG